MSVRTACGFRRVDRFFARVFIALIVWTLTPTVMAAGTGIVGTGEDVWLNNCASCHQGALPFTGNAWANIRSEIQATASNISDRAGNSTGTMVPYIALTQENAGNIACYLQGGSGTGIDCRKTVPTFSIDGVADGATTTNDTPTLRGTLSVALTDGESLHIHRGATDIVVPGGNIGGTAWSYTETSPLPNGTYTYYARIENNSGPTPDDPERIIHTMTVDTTAPEGAGSILNIEDDVVPVTGRVNKNGYTNDTGLLLTGTTPSTEDIVRVYANGLFLGNALRSGNAWRFTASGLNDSTAYSFTIRLFRSSNGTEGPASLPYSVRIDTTAPTQTTTISAQDDANSITLANGDSTADTTPLLSGTLSAALAEGENLHVFRSGIDSGSASVAGLNWTFADTGLATGTSYSYSARVVDAAGNLGPVSTPFGITLAAPVNINLTGRVTLADGTPCREVDAFFDTAVRTTAVVGLDEMGRELLSLKTQRLGPGGEFQIFAREGKAPVKLRATCEGTAGGVAVMKETAEAPVNGGAPVKLGFANHRPVISRIAIFYPANSSTRVSGVPPGSTVRVEVTATDPDGDALHYRWGESVESGSFISQDSSSVLWTVPRKRGLHTLYVQVSDAKAGGFATGPVGLGKLKVFPITVSTDAGRVRDHGRREPVLGAADLLFGQDLLLAFSIRNDHQMLDTRKGACQYYKKIRMVADCQVDGTPIGAMTFNQWKADSGLGKRRPKRGEVVARYRNRIDLNLARDMHGRALPNGEAAFYVCNHVGAADMIRVRRNQVACVAMDYRRIEGFNDGKPFLRAMVFGAEGGLRLSVDLDGRGEKFVPGSCTTCHGGAGYFNPTGGSAESPAYPEDGSGLADLGIDFLPFDPDNFEFSAFPGLGRAAQNGKFRKFNKIVSETASSPAARSLIEGWYPRAKSARFKRNFVPAEWNADADDRNFYRKLIKPYCRTCHVNLARSGREDLDFDRPDDVANNGNFFATLCGTKDDEERIGDLAQIARMPNAANVFSLIQDSRDPTNFFSKKNPAKTEVASYFQVLKSRDKVAASRKTLLDEQCNLPWLNESLWGALPSWQRDIRQKIPE